MFKETLYLGFICLIIAAITLSSAFATAGFIFGIAVTMIISIVWGIFLWRKWAIGNILSLLTFVLGISLGAIYEGSRLILLISLLATLATWDLASFYACMSTSENIADKEQLIRSHLLRLAGVLMLGLVLPLVAFAFQFDLKFWQAFLLGILLLAGLSQMFAQLKRGSNE